MDILLDMDEVLIEFNKPAHKLLDIPSDPWPWDIGDFYLSVYDDAFWKRLNADWWSNREWTPFGKELYNMCKAFVGADHIWLLTTPAPFGGADWVGKADWVRRELPEMIGRMSMLSHKSLCSRRGSVLFDDRYDSVEAFRKLDGEGIVVPACWNFLHKKDPMKLCRQRLMQVIKRGV